MVMLSFRSEAREASGSETAQIHHPCRRRGGPFAASAARSVCSAAEGASNWCTCPDRSGRTSLWQGTPRRTTRAWADRRGELCNTSSWRSADAKADRLPQLAQELVRLKVDVIAAIFTPCALAAKQATRGIPIFVIAGDPIGTGLVASLARPGGNITGLSNMGAEAAGKCVELFREMLPSLSRVAVLANPVDPFTRSILEQVQLAGRTTSVEIAPGGNGPSA